VSNEGRKDGRVVPAGSVWRGVQAVGRANIYTNNNKVPILLYLYSSVPSFETSDRQTVSVTYIQLQLSAT